MLPGSLGKCGVLIKLWEGWVYGGLQEVAQGAGEVQELLGAMSSWAPVAQFLYWSCSR